MGDVGIVLGSRRRLILTNDGALLSLVGLLDAAVTPGLLAVSLVLGWTRFASHGLVIGNRARAKTGRRTGG